MKIWGPDSQKNEFSLDLKSFNFFSPGKALMKQLKMPRPLANKPFSGKNLSRYSYTLPRLLPFLFSNTGVKLVSKETA
jgi:hypothetical protein